MYFTVKDVSWNYEIIRNILDYKQSSKCFELHYQWLGFRCKDLLSDGWQILAPEAIILNPSLEIIVDQLESFDVGAHI